MDKWIKAAQEIAENLDYDQVVIIARRVSGGEEHVSTFGKSPADKKVAAHMGQFIAHKVMGWPECKHEKSHGVGQGFAQCDVCDTIMPDELNFWDFPGVKAEWPK